MASPRTKLPATACDKLDLPELADQCTQTHCVLSQSAQERREWKRFGDAVAQQPEHSVTVQSREDVPFERTKAQKSTRDEKQQLTLQNAMQSNDKNAVTAKYAQQVALGSICTFIFKQHP